ncbi:D-mannonate oxidoreductase [Alicyclobacillus cellulosilyticus]|uniref:D-mannonate oxidoreductase n=1 Tax=Alicyclobacillus cellulosilyticus TaxID=1003997 RepID=A0A917NIN9_9BACL|nr:SDR family oxidoreductase [Alicyclobacillus cellulosilyticus]GGJ03516.1 D-mannonate oxidoreductase [Alicyclobacillus cellulosilyticus]
MANLFDLHGKVAVVLGGTSTLGGAIAAGLAAHGAKVAVAGRNRGKAEAVVARIREGGGEAEVFLTQPTDKQALAELASAVQAWADGCDILVNSVGTNSSTPFFELTMDEWDHIMAVNLKSVVLACQVFGALMMEQGRGGSIINISSVSSDPPLSKVFTYSASKAGVNSVTKYLAREWAPYGIRVNAIIPGFFPAEQNRSILTPERTEAILRHTPMGRFGSPEELQGTAVWLASERASGFVTGALIRVDGGFGAMTI